MTAPELYEELTRLYPEEHRSSYDFDGLQVCPEAEKPIRRIVTALDLTRETVAEAKRLGADLIVTHHPVFFHAVRTLSPDSSRDAANCTELIRAGIALITLHTRFDAGVGGINDTLTKKLALTSPEPFGFDEEVCKIGRIGTVKEQTPAEFAAACARALSHHVLLTAGEKAVHKVAVIGGGAGDYIDAFLLSDAELFLTGEVSHHHRLAAAEAGKSIVEAGHWGSEIIFCDAIFPVLKKLIPSAEIFPFAATPNEICVF